MLLRSLLILEMAHLENPNFLLLISYIDPTLLMKKVNLCNPHSNINKVILELVLYLVGCNIQC